MAQTGNDDAFAKYRINNNGAHADNKRGLAATTVAKGSEQKLVRTGRQPLMMGDYDYASLCNGGGKAKAGGDDDPLAKYRQPAGGLDPSDKRSPRNADPAQLKKELTTAYLMPKKTAGDDAFAKYRISESGDNSMDMSSLKKQLSTSGGNTKKEEEDDDPFAKYKVKGEDHTAEVSAELRREMTSCNVLKKPADEDELLSKYRIQGKPQPAKGNDISMLRKELTSSHLARKKDDEEDELAKYKIQASTPGAADAAALKRQLTTANSLKRKDDNQDEALAKYRISGNNNNKCSKEQEEKLRQELSSSASAPTKKPEDDDPMAKYKIKSDSASLTMSAPAWSLSAQPKNEALDPFDKYRIKDQLAPAESLKRSSSAEEVDPIAKYRLGGAPPDNQPRVKSGEWNPNAAAATNPFSSADLRKQMSNARNIK